MKTILTRTLILLLALMLCIPAALADFDPFNVLRTRQSYARIMLEDRDRGACGMLRGDIELTVVFLTVEGEPWTIEHLGGTIGSVTGAIATLHEEAAAHGVELNITPVYYSTTFHGDVDSENWFENAIATIPEFAGQTDWEDRPVLFALNIEGRSFARTGGSVREYVIFYIENDAGTVRHELLHLYGAEDFYFQEDVEAAAGEYFPDSVMLNSDYDSVVDPLTAYLVGWTDEPDAQATAFLNAIASLTNEEVEIARDLDQAEETITFKLEYGPLRMGVHAGLGLHQWTSGASNVADGIDGKRTGRGTYVGADGVTYSGDFINGHYTGKGTATWPTGESYTGDFIGGRRTGKGTFTWADGSSYTGEFVDDAITGMGTLTFANGEVYVGQFVDGKMHGLGTIYYADGSMLTGTWSHDVFVGK